MNNEVDLARGWLVKAASDISAARLVVDGDGPYDTACFHAQQAIEKALKGFLALRRQAVTRT
jgi:HEPN domain-containing protein